MRTCLNLASLLFFGFTPCFAQIASVDAPEEKPGMTSLFTGINLNGWEGNPELWTIVDGAIRGETTKESPTKGNTFLIWRDGVLKDFELRLSFKKGQQNNSGIQYRSKRISDNTAKNAWVVRGYQFEIRNENAFPNVSGFIYDEGGKRQRLCLVGERASSNPEAVKEVAETFMDEATFKKLMRIDEWNDVVIVAKGKQILHYLNGKLIVDFTDNCPSLAAKEGVLALQLHAGTPMWVEFKNIRLREIKETKKVIQKDKASATENGSQTQNSDTDKRDEPASKK